MIIHLLDISIVLMSIFQGNFLHANSPNPLAFSPLNIIYCILYYNNIICNIKLFQKYNRVVSGTSCINCFKCSSLNGSNANCEDPFHPAMSSYIEKCMVPKRGHVGMFPANFCTKIIGKNGK